MKVSVDLSKCTGHARCYDASPELFTFDDEGLSSIGTDLEVPPDREEAVRIAVLSCPEQALSIDED